MVQCEALLYSTHCVHHVLSFLLCILLLKVFSVIVLSPKLDCFARVSLKIPALLDIINHHLFSAYVDLYAHVCMSRLRISYRTSLPLILVSHSSVWADLYRKKSLSQGNEGLWALSDSNLRWAPAVSVYLMCNRLMDKWLLWAKTSSFPPPLTGQKSISTNMQLEGTALALLTESKSAWFALTSHHFMVMLQPESEVVCLVHLWSALALCITLFAQMWSHICTMMLLFLPCGKLCYMPRCSDY